MNVVSCKDVVFGKGYDVVKSLDTILQYSKSFTHVTCLHNTHVVHALYKCVLYYTLPILF